MLRLLTLGSWAVVTLAYAMSSIDATGGRSATIWDLVAAISVMGFVLCWPSSAFSVIVLFDLRVLPCGLDASTVFGALCWQSRLFGGSRGGAGDRPERDRVRCVCLARFPRQPTLPKSGLPSLRMQISIRPARSAAIVAERCWSPTAASRSQLAKTHRAIALVGIVRRGLLVRHLVVFPIEFFRNSPNSRY